MESNQFGVSFDAYGILIYFLISKILSQVSKLAK